MSAPKLDPNTTTIDDQDVLNLSLALDWIAKWPKAPVNVDDTIISCAAHVKRALQTLKLGYGQSTRENIPRFVSEACECARSIPDLSEGSLQLAKTLIKEKFEKFFIEGAPEKIERERRQAELTAALKAKRHAKLHAKQFDALTMPEVPVEAVPAVRKSRSSLEDRPLEMRAPSDPFAFYNKHPRHIGSENYHRLVQSTGRLQSMQLEAIDFEPKEKAFVRALLAKEVFMDGFHPSELAALLEEAKLLKKVPPLSDIHQTITKMVKVGALAIESKYAGEVWYDLNRKNLSKL